MNAVVRMALVGLACAVLAAGCKGEMDPRCAKVAASSRMAGIAAIEKRYDGEELESLIEQIDQQMPKVEKQCQDKLADDDTGIWDRWADCMAAATDASEVMKCKSVK